MLPKKVLIISYYWPPAGGGGVQRWLKMTKYFAENNWQPIVFTPENPDLPAIDESLLKEVHPAVTVIKNKIWEPYVWFRKFTGKKKNEKIYSGFIDEKKGSSLAQKIAVFIRGNFFIPDARKFWIAPSIKFLTNYLKENQVDVIISTGPPHSTHLIAMGVKKNTGIKWIADFRDPWTKIDFYSKLQMTTYADQKHHQLEKEVLTTADKIVTVSYAWATEFEAISGKKNITVIHNGFDHADFEEQVLALDKEFSICHIGSMNADRNPTTLWKVLADLCKNDKDFAAHLKIRLMGQVDFAVLESIKKMGLAPYLEKIDFLPHTQAIATMKQSQVLLLCINNTENQNGIIPGKLYEYLGSGRPIICVGPDNNDASQILQDAQGDVVAPYQDEAKTKLLLLKYYEKYLQKELKADSKSIMKYSRKALAKRYTELLNSL